MSQRNRTSSDQLSKKVMDAYDRLIQLPQYKGKVELPIATVAREAGVGRSTINNHDSLQNICKGLDEEGKPRLKVVKPPSATMAELNKLIQAHAKYDELLSRLTEYQEEITTKIWDRYTEVYADLQLRDKGAIDAEPLRRKNNQLRDELNEVKRQLEAQKFLNKGVEKEALVAEKVTSLYKPYVVSPDKYLLDKNRYSWSKARANNAWAKAHLEFEELLKTTSPVKVYLMCGVQCSGKTTWIKGHKPTEPGTHIYFDAVLKSSSERAVFISKIKDIYPEAEVVCVRVIASLETCLSRQRDRATNDPQAKLVPPNIIQANFELFEEVEMDELFDQILIVRTDMSD